MASSVRSRTRWSLALVAAAGAALALLAAAPAGAQARIEAEAVARAGQGPVRVLVRLEPGRSTGIGAPSAVAGGARVAADQDRVLAAAGPTVTDVVRFSHVPGFAATVDAAGLAALAAAPGVAAVTLDALSRPQLAESVPLVGAPAVWATGVDGTAWTVAVLDTGVATGHQAFAGKVAAEACFSSTVPAQGATSLCPGGGTSAFGAGAGANCTSVFPDCDHGTHVAGIAAGNGGGVTGVARGARIVPVQVFSFFSNPTLCAPLTACLLSYESDQIRALEHVLTLAGPGNANRVAAANLSLGGGLFTDACDADRALFKQAVDDLRRVGIATVVAAGNDGAANALSAPACVSTVVAVGATTKADAVWPTGNRSSRLALVAPGVSITSAAPGGVATRSGTSMAAPHVAGAWALAKARLPTASVDEIRDAMRATGTTVTDAATGLRGPRLRANLAVSALATTLPPAPAGLHATVTGQNVTLAWNVQVTSLTPTSYVVEVGSSPGAADLAAIDTASPVRSASFTSVPAGTYRVRVRSRSAAGTSGPSNEVTVVVPGTGACVAPPPPPGVPTASVAASRLVTLTWTGSGTGVRHYLLDVGPSAGTTTLTLNTGGPATTMAAAAPPGTYFVRLRAVNACGSSLPSPERVVTVP